MILSNPMSSLENVEIEKAASKDRHPSTTYRARPRAPSAPPAKWLHRAVRTDTTRRVVERGTGRIDASEVLREALDAWIVKRK
jgi:hypothetical protein